MITKIIHSADTHTYTYIHTYTLRQVHTHHNNAREKVEGYLLLKLSKLSVREGVELLSGVLSLKVVLEWEDLCLGVEWVLCEGV